MSIDFSDNAKMNKFKFFENNICQINTPNGRLYYKWSLKNRKEGFYYIGYATFNWNSINCEKCNVEYGCININYNKDNNTDYHMNKYYNRPITLPNGKIYVKPVLQKFSGNFCIGCFMSAHNPIECTEFAPKPSKEKNNGKKQHPLSYWIHK
jgi:hypothetical protein